MRIASDDILNRVKPLLAEGLKINVNDITLETAIKNSAEWTSLTHLEVIYMIEKEFGLKIPIESYGKLSSVYEIVKFLSMETHRNIENPKLVVSAMGVIVCPTNRTTLLLQQGKEYVFPKGRMEEGENIIQTCIREVAEESGVLIRDSDFGGVVNKFAFYFEKDHSVKYIVALTFKVQHEMPITPLVEEHYLGGYWCPYEEALQILTHEDGRKSLLKAIELFDK